MRRCFALGLMCLTLVGAGQARAQEDPALERRETLAGRYIELSIGDNLKSGFQAYIDDLVDGDDAIETAEARWIRANLPELMLAMVDDLIARLAPIYAQTLTEQELVALVSFYDTAIGREIARKTISLSIQTEPVVQAAVVEYTTEFTTKFCAVFDCGSNATGRSSNKGVQPG